MTILDKINPVKSTSLLLFYVAMALSIVYFDLFQSIEDSSKRSPSFENLELVVPHLDLPSSLEFDLQFNQFSHSCILEIPRNENADFQRRLFHQNRNLAHQFKEIEKNQFEINYFTHLQIAQIISHQKMEEEAYSPLI